MIWWGLGGRTPAATHTDGAAAVPVVVESAAVPPGAVLILPGEVEVPPGMVAAPAAGGGAGIRRQLARARLFTGFEVGG